MGPIVNSGDRNDPANYVSFESYATNASHVLTLEALVFAWNRAHPDDPVNGNGMMANSGYNPITRSPSSSANPASASDDGCGMTRVFAALQLVGGGIELIIGGGALLAPEPTVTKVIGAVALVHGFDTVQASVRTIATCQRTSTFTQQGAAATAEGLGASPATAQTIGMVTDVTIGVGSTFGVGLLSRAPAASGQLVHLTNATSADAIRASQTLGLGRSTIYAGPESLANARGWSILWRTGRSASTMSEAILLPSAANSSFLVVKPIGAFSGWQAINGTVFSAGTGSFNLATGAFTRTGAATNQIAVYAIDTAIMATVRAPGYVAP